MKNYRQKFFTKMWLCTFVLWAIGFTSCLSFADELPTPCINCKVYTFLTSNGGEVSSQTVVLNLSDQTFSTALQTANNNAVQAGRQILAQGGSLANAQTAYLNSIAESQKSVLATTDAMYDSSIDYSSAVGKNKIVGAISDAAQTMSSSGQGVACMEVAASSQTIIETSGAEFALKSTMTQMVATGEAYRLLAGAPSLAAIGDSVGLHAANVVESTNPAGIATSVFSSTTTSPSAMLMKLNTPGLQSAGYLNLAVTNQNGLLLDAAGNPVNYDPGTIGAAMREAAALEASIANKAAVNATSELAAAVADVPGVTFADAAGNALSSDAASGILSNLIPEAAGSLSSLLTGGLSTIVGYYAMNYINTPQPQVAYGCTAASCEDLSYILAAGVASKFNANGSVGGTTAGVENTVSWDSNGNRWVNTVTAQGGVIAGNPFFNQLGSDANKSLGVKGATSVTFFPSSVSGTGETSSTMPDQSIITVIPGKAGVVAVSVPIPGTFDTKGYQVYWTQNTEGGIFIESPGGAEKVQLPSVLNSDGTFSVNFNGTFPAAEPDSYADIIISTIQTDDGTVNVSVDADPNSPIQTELSALTSYIDPVNPPIYTPPPIQLPPVNTDPWLGTPGGGDSITCYWPIAGNDPKYVCEGGPPMRGPYGD